jgi:hypothetical protein
VRAAAYGHAMTTLPLTIRPTTPGDTDALGDRPLRGRVWTAELDGEPLAVVAVDGSAFADDPVARAEHAVRVLLMHRGRVISDAGGSS